MLSDSCSVLIINVFVHVYTHILWQLNRSPYVRCLPELRTGGFC